MAKTTPILAGLRLRCGNCGKGKLFSGYLKLNSACPVCGRDMTAADTADGPAFFVGFGVLILLAPFLFLLPMSPLPAVAKVFALVGHAPAAIAMQVAQQFLRASDAVQLVGDVRTAQRITLQEVTGQQLQDGRLVFGFDALGDDFHVEAVAKRDDGFQQLPAGRADIELLDERSVDLQAVEFELLQVAQR